MVEGTGGRSEEVDGLTCPGGFCFLSSLFKARDLLARNLANCKSNLERNKADTLKLKDSITITEVSMARIYNHDVSLRKK